MTCRELVLSTLEFRNTEGRVPRQLWTLPWATERYPEMIQKMNCDFGWDMSGPAGNPENVYRVYERWNELR